MQTQEPQYKQLVPEDVAPVRLTVQSSRRYTDIKFGGVRRQRLQHMEKVQSQNPARLARNLDPGPPPQAGPPMVRGQQLRELRGRPDTGHSRPQGLPIAGSRDVYRATVLSTTASRAGSSGSTSAWKI